MANGLTAQDEPPIPFPSVISRVRRAGATADRRGRLSRYGSGPCRRRVRADRDALRRRLQVGGVLVLDGSLQGKTAWLTRRYHVVPDGRGPEYAGYPTYPMRARRSGSISRSNAHGLCLRTPMATRRPIS